MHRFPFILLLLALFGMVNPSPAAETAEAVRCSAPPVVDGKLDDACWTQALKFDRFNRLNTGKPAQSRTEALLLYDADALYIGFRCFLPPGGTIRADRKTPYENDHVEVMVDPNRTQNRYFQYLVDVNGKVFDAYYTEGGHVNDKKWQGGARTATFRGDGFWSAEIRIPFAALDINPEGNLWGFNFARAGWEEPGREESSVTPSGLFHVAGEFLPVAKLDITPSDYAWEISAPVVQTVRDGGKIAAKVTLPVTNGSDRARDIRIELALAGGAAGVAGTAIVEHFAPRETRNIVFQGLNLNAAGSFRTVIDLSDPASRRLFKRRRGNLEITFQPLDIQLELPAYRQAIFASQNLNEVVYTVKSNLALPAETPLATGIRDAAGKILVQKELKAPGEVRFPTASLPFGRLTIFVDGGKLGRAEHPLRKLPFKEGEVWRDASGIWHIGQTPFFLVFNWGSHAIPGVDASVHQNGDKYWVSGDLMWSSSPTHKFLRADRITPEMEAIIRENVRKIAKNNKLFAIYLCDEPEISGVNAAVLKHFADIVRDEDPYHPLIVSNDTVAGTRDFYYVAEINGLHPYPNPAKGKPRNDFAKVVTFVEQAVAMNRSHGNRQTIAFLQQGFNYGDCGAANSRIPTFDEIRTQFLLAITLGANAAEFFNHTTLHYPELYIGLSEVAKELTGVLAPAMTVPDGPNAQSNRPDVAVRVKKVGGEFWIFACGTAPGNIVAEISVPGLGDRKLQVLREGRTVAGSNDRFTDSFRNFDARVYTTDTRDFGLRPLAVVEAEIAAKNQARQKPGNLAFQMFEDDRLVLTASSNAYGSRRSDATLWHVTDGIVDGRPAAGPMSADGIMTFTAQPGVPVWIAMQFPAPVEIGRIAVYGAEKSLRDYEIQLWQNDAWRTVGKAENQTDDFREFKFAPCRSDRIRLYITKLNGPRARVHEIEVYAH